MTMPVLAILGGTRYTQQLFTLSKDGKLPFTCKSIDGIKEKEEVVTYCNDQMHLDLQNISQKYVLGSGNLIEDKDVQTYYQRALPKTGCIFQSYHYILNEPWHLIHVKKSLALVAKSTLKFEFVKILQALRVISSDKLENVNIVFTEVLEQKALVVNAMLANIKLSIHLVPDADEKEFWSFVGQRKKIDFDLAEQTYEVLTLLDPKGSVHHSFHRDKRSLSDASIWDLIFKSEKSLQNLTNDDWKWVESV